MSHIFISYSHRDKDYANRLYDSLLEQGFEAWIDDRIDYGTHWPREIESRLRECAAFILIISPQSYESEWVQNELSFAREMGKPIFPLLLEGNLWWHLGTTQYVDVKGGNLPPIKFFARLAAVALPQQLSNALSKIERPVLTGEPVFKKAEPGKIRPPLRLSKSIKIASIGIAGIVIVALISLSLLKNGFSPTQSPTETGANISSPTLLPSSRPIELFAATVIRTPTPFPEQFTDAKGVIMRLVPASEFMMGSDSDRHPDEGPIHQVYLDDFYMDQFEVTNALYEACVKAGSCDPPKNTSSASRTIYYGNPVFNDYPVIYVDWNMAKNYCE